MTPFLHSLIGFAFGWCAGLLFAFWVQRKSFEEFKKKILEDLNVKS